MAENPVGFSGERQGMVRARLEREFRAEEFATFLDKARRVRRDRSIGSINCVQEVGRCGGNPELNHETVFGKDAVHVFALN